MIIAGRPSMGKTAIALNFGAHVAINSKKVVLVFSMEMPAELLSMRILGSEGSIDLQRFRKGQLEDHDYPKLSQVVMKAQDAKMYIDDRGGLSTAEIKATIKRFTKQVTPSIDMIIVDYIQLMSSGKVGVQRAEAVADISRELKKIAKEFNVPVVALSQLNRSLEQRPNKRPIMSDLKESGGIEQDADLILFIYRDEVYNPDTMDKGTAEIIIAKQRNGPIGTVRVTFADKYSRFSNHAYQQSHSSYD